MMAHEYTFFNGTDYTVDAYIADVTTRYGGIDSVLLWPTYPNIGVDDRNQYDMIADMPAGFVSAVRRLQDYYNVSVLLPYNPWDTGTRDDGVSDDVAMAAQLNQTGTRGFNGDTLSSVGVSFFTSAMNNSQGPPCIEPEDGGDQNTLYYTKMNWRSAPLASGVPGVARWKWLEHRHVSHVSERWATDRTGGIQSAFFNADGYETWENVWGNAPLG
jgi:iron(II)-dependent oxidoreductase